MHLPDEGEGGGDVSDEPKAPADFLERVRMGQVDTADVERNRRATEAIRAFWGSSLINAGSAAPPAKAFALAAIEATARHGGESCPHAEAITARVDPGHPDTGDLLQMIVATGQTLCTPCSDELDLPDSAEHHGRCDICEEPAPIARGVTCVLGNYVIHASICRSCAAFYDSAFFGNGHSARWEDVLDAQVRLLDLARSGRLRTPAEPQAFSQLPPFLPDALLHAEPVFVSRDVFEAWQFAYPAFEPEPIGANEPFAQAGFVLLPRPLDFIRAGTSNPAKALLWAPAHGSVFVGGFTQDGSRDWGLSSMLMIPFDHTPDDVLADAAKQYGWKTNVPDEDEKLLRQWTIMQAFWRMARQFVRVPERVSRAGRRAARRAQLRHDENVTVIRLRRARHEAPETERDVDWSCRWIVRGHWRRLADDRQTWVNAYVKGPEDKPLRVTDRVWEFVR